MRWIKEYENLHQKMQQENDKETPQHIPMYFYYVDAQNRVEKIKKRRFIPPSFSPKEGVSITAEELLYVIREKRRPQYDLDEILFYEVAAIPKETSTNINTKAPALRQIPLTLTDIELKPALFIFHDINSIIFIYKAKRPNRARTECSRSDNNHNHNPANRTLKSRTKRTTRRQKIDVM